MNLTCPAAFAVAALFLAQLCPAPAEGATGRFKIATYNIQAGKGEPGLPGRTATFVKNMNCTDPTQPMNAWGVGLVQATLARDVGADPSVIALGLEEAWETVCGSPANVQRVLGWAARTEGHNGIALLARFGFAGPEQWIQLDTSLNANPADTMWVVRAPVCLDAACTSSVPVFATHWYGQAPNASASYTRQAEQTISFMRRFPDAYSVLAGDLNVWEDPAPLVCGQPPSPYGLDQLRNANYIDAWPYVHGTGEGSTGMVNRVGCGNPEGYLWKRIDYMWSAGLLPLSATRWGMMPAGEESPSDHVGVIAEYTIPGNAARTIQITSPAAGCTVSGVVSVAVAMSDDSHVTSVDLLVDGNTTFSATAAPWTLRWDSASGPDGQHTLVARAWDDWGQATTSTPVAVLVAHAQPRASEIVLYARHATVIAGAWRRVADASAADGEAVVQPDAGAPKVTTALAAPANYFELTFDAVVGQPYRLWLRLKAEGNYYGNDSVHVQFTGAVDRLGQHVYQIGTTASTVVVLEECSGCALAGWGWQDNGYGVNALGPVIYFDSTSQHTIRIQSREDGVSIDQIVLSPDRYLTDAPGALRNDATILPESGLGLPPAPTSPVEVVLYAREAMVIAGDWRRFADPTAAGGEAVSQPDLGAPKVTTPLASPTNYFDLAFDAVAGLPYRLWLRLKAERNYYGNDSVHVQFTGAVNALGQHVYEIGTTTSTVVVLEECSGCPISGWGWQDNGYGLNALGPLVYFDSSGRHTIRIQSREDGVLIDQVVLSPKRYLTAAPGAVRDDTTILAPPNPDPESSPSLTHLYRP